MKSKCLMHGLLAEFASPIELRHAVEMTRRAGYAHIDALSPFAIEGMTEAASLPRSRVPMIMLLSGLSGGIVGFAMQFWIAAVDYRLNVGGRPYDSWPSFIPITFELTILGAAIGGVIGLLILCGLPRPHHPLFEVAEFEWATNDRFFLYIEADDKLFDEEATMRFLKEMAPCKVIAVIDGKEDER